MDELLALIGQHWRLTLIYPGGLTALGALALTYLLSAAPRRQRRTPIAPADVAAATAWLLAITLLPLPQAGWPYNLDLVAFLLLIELPQLWRLTRRGDSATLIALLNVYPLLALAIAALGQSAGTLVLRDINRDAGPLHWIGLSAWAIALPPLLALGPWRESSHDLLASLRRMTHTALLVAAALPAHDSTPIYAAGIAFVCAVLPLAALDRWWHGDPQRLSAWQPWLVAALLLAIGILSGQRFLARLG